MRITPRMKNDRSRVLPSPLKLKQCLRRALRSLFVAISLSSGMIAGATDYPNTSAFAVDYEKNEAWYKQCINVQYAQPIVTDIPTTQLMDKLGECNAEDLYYDTKSDNRTALSIGDWSKVVACAYRQSDEIILMMLHANGFGVKRNLPLALKYVCSIGGAKAEVIGRVERLSAWMKEPSTDNSGRDFDYCDDITSGMSAGHCAAIGERQSAKARAGRIEEFTKLLRPSEALLFARLQNSTRIFADARGNLETDASGTTRAADSITAKAVELDAFVEDIERFESGQLPKY